MKKTKPITSAVLNATTETESHRERCPKDGHKNKPFEFFCLDCRRGLCSMCLIKDGVAH